MKIRVIYKCITNRISSIIAGADPGFQVRRRAHLKKLRRAEGGAKIFGVFRVKNHDFTPKNHIFPILRGEGRAKLLGYFMWKITILRQQNHIFTNFRGGPRVGCAPPPLNPPLNWTLKLITIKMSNVCNNSLRSSFTFPIYDCLV